MEAWIVGITRRTGEWKGDQRGRKPGSEAVGGKGQVQGYELSCMSKCLGINRLVWIVLYIHTSILLGFSGA